MPHHFIETSTLQAMKLVLNGGVLSGKAVIDATGKIRGLHGLTLVIRSTTVTFSDADGVGLTAAQVKAAIEAAVTGVTVTWADGHLALSHASGVTVATSGTANTIFGFSTSVAVTGVVYAFPGGAAPRVLGVEPGARADSYFAWVEVP